MNYIYILTNDRHTTLYIGVTSNLQHRVNQHQNLDSGFTARYQLHKLVYVERYESIVDAINREKQLKRWHRDWKWNLIKLRNPTLIALDYTII